MSTQETLATIEQGTTEWLARILEPGRASQYFEPRGMYFGISMSNNGFLERAVRDTYPTVRFVSEEEFNAHEVQWYADHMTTAQASAIWNAFEDLVR